MIKTVKTSIKEWIQLIKYSYSKIFTRYTSTNQVESKAENGKKQKQNQIRLKIGRPIPMALLDLNN